MPQIRQFHVPKQHECQVRQRRLTWDQILRLRESRHIYVFARRLKAVACDLDYQEQRYFFLCDMKTHSWSGILAEENLPARELWISK